MELRNRRHMHLAITTLACLGTVRAQSEEADEEDGLNDKELIALLVSLFLVLIIGGLVLTYCICSRCVAGGQSKVENQEQELAEKGKAKPRSLSIMH